MVPYKPHPDSEPEFYIRANLTACGTSLSQGEVDSQSSQKSGPDWARTPLPLLEKERLGEVFRDHSSLKFSTWTWFSRETVNKTGPLFANVSISATKAASLTAGEYRQVLR